MSEENSWVDFSNASSWEESISQMETIFSKFEIGFQLASSPSSMDMISTPYVFNELQYNIQYWYSSFSDAYNDEHMHWPPYMMEMMLIEKPVYENATAIFKQFGVSEYILIELASQELRNYVDLKQCKQLLSSAIIASSRLEKTIPIFVEGPPNTHPFIGAFYSPQGVSLCSTNFSSNRFSTSSLLPSSLPTPFHSLPSFLTWFHEKTSSSSLSLRRSYSWTLYPSTSSSWRNKVYSKEELQEHQPVLFMLQGFSGIPLWGPAQNPLREMNIQVILPVVDLQNYEVGLFNYSLQYSFSFFVSINFNTANKSIPSPLHPSISYNHFLLHTSLSDLKSLPLSSMLVSLCRCLEEATVEGDRHVLFNAGKRFYNQLVNQENIQHNSHSVFASMMDIFAGNNVVSTEAIVDAVKYIFTKRLQVCDGKTVVNIRRRNFVPSKYLYRYAGNGSEWTSPDLNESDEIDEDKPILLPKRIIEIPIQGETNYFVLPRASGSYHVDRAILPSGEYDWVVHSAPIDSLVTLMSLRVAEILYDQPLKTLSLFWYLLVSVIEFHYEQQKLLPHLGCVLDNFDNICIQRPPLPSFQYNLLHQKLTVLNCCIEEKRNNSRYHPSAEKDADEGYTYGDSFYEDKGENNYLGEENSSDSEISFFSDSEATPRMDETSNHSSPPPHPQSHSQYHHRHSLSASIDHPTKPEGKGILNWSGWYLVGTTIPCFIPITKDKDILTEDQVRLQQEQLAQTESAVNEIRDVFVATVADDMQAFKAANPQARFEDFVRWHSPRDWTPSDTNPLGELSARMQGDNAFRTLYDATSAVAASHQQRLFNADCEGEIAMDYLRTISPLSVIHQLLIPFLGASCYILDNVDSQTASLPTVKQTIDELKKVVQAISRSLDRSGEIPHELLVDCQEKLERAERTVTQASSLLHTTHGDEQTVQALLSNQFDTDLVSIGQESCNHFVSLLLQEGRNEENAESCFFEVWGESNRSSEDDELSLHTNQCGHHGLIEKKSNEVRVSLALSECDVFHT